MKLDTKNPPIEFKRAHLKHEDIYKELLKLNNKKANNPIKKCTKDLNRLLTKEDTHMANKHMKRCSTTRVIRDMHFKTSEIPLYTIRMAKTQNTDKTKC